MSQSLAELEARLVVLEAQYQELDRKFLAVTCQGGALCACPFSVDGVASCIQGAVENVKQAKSNLDSIHNAQPRSDS